MFITPQTSQPNLSSHPPTTLLLKAEPLPAPTSEKTNPETPIIEQLQGTWDYQKRPRPHDRRKNRHLSSVKRSHDFTHKDHATDLEAAEIKSLTMTFEKNTINATFKKLPKE